MASKEPDHEHREDEDATPAEEEDTGAQIAPIIKLEEVAVSTGEENEDPILDLSVFFSFTYICISDSNVLRIFYKFERSECIYFIY